MRLTDGIEPTAPSGSALESCPRCRKRGQALYLHYLEYRDSDGLAEHLSRHVPRFPNPPSGYGYDEWLIGVLAWHRHRIARKSEDKRRESEDSGDPGFETWIEASGEPR